MTSSRLVFLSLRSKPPVDYARTNSSKLLQHAARHASRSRSFHPILPVASLQTAGQLCPDQQL